MSSFKKVFRVIAVTATASMFAACGPASPASSGATVTEVSQPATVNITSDEAFGQFAPQEMTVAPGAVVEFYNATVYPHNVVFADTSVTSSPLFQKDEMWSMVAPAQPGTYSYVCTLHPGMRGTLNVE